MWYRVGEEVRVVGAAVSSGAAEHFSLAISSAADCPALLVFCTSRRLSMRLPEGARRRNRPLAVQL